MASTRLVYVTDGKTTYERHEVKLHFVTHQGDEMTFTTPFGNAREASLYLATVIQLANHDRFNGLAKANIFAEDAWVLSAYYGRNDILFRIREWVADSVIESEYPALLPYLDR